MDPHLDRQLTFGKSVTAIPERKCNLFSRTVAAETIVYPYAKKKKKAESLHHCTKINLT